MEKPLISVVIPVYNIGSYLTACLDSVAGQTYDNLEIIVIDDGSTDNSGEIIDWYAAQDKRFVVIHQENAKLVKVWKKGIETATGEFVSFVGGDDYITPDCIEKLYLGIVEMGVDITCGDHYRVSPDYCIKREEQWKGVIDGDTYMKYQLTNYMEGYICIKLFRREFLQGLDFPHVISEDKYLSVQIAAKGPWLGRVKEGIYYYVNRKDSLTHGAKPLEEGIKLADHIEQFLRKEGLYEKYAPWMTITRLNLYWLYINSTSRKSIARNPYVIDLQNRAKDPEVQKLMKEYLPWDRRAVIRLHRSDSTVWLGKTLTTVCRIAESIKKRLPGSQK